MLCGHFGPPGVVMFLFASRLMWVRNGPGNCTVATRKGRCMARIIVTTEQSERPNGRVLLDEFVFPDHLSDDHSAHSSWSDWDGQSLTPNTKASDGGQAITRF